MDLNAEQIAIVRDIREFAVEVGLPPLLLVGLGYLENTGFDPYDTTGDDGRSVGIFQIHLPAHPPWPAAHWLGREGTRNAMAEMRTRWLRAYRAMPSRFEADPAAFLYAWWRPAQGGDAPLTPERCRWAIERARAALAAADGDEQELSTPTAPASPSGPSPALTPRWPRRSWP
jgi:hypothetical protein